MKWDIDVDYTNVDNEIKSCLSEVKTDFDEIITALSELLVEGSALIEDKDYQMSVCLEISDDKEYYINNWDKEKFQSELSRAKEKTIKSSDYRNDEERKKIIIDTLDRIGEEISKASDENREEICELMKQVEKVLKSKDINYTEIGSIVNEIYNSTRIISGKYIDREKKIVLYNKALGSIKENANNWKLTFWHELFHAYHYKLASICCTDLEGAANNGKIVKESLAAFFEYLIAINIICYKDRTKKYVDDWSKNNMHYWPYAGAQYVDKNSFVEILKISLKNIDDAFELLIKQKMVNYKLER